MTRPDPDPHDPRGPAPVETHTAAGDRPADDSRPVDAGEDRTVDAGENREVDAGENREVDAGEARTVDAGEARTSGTEPTVGGHAPQHATPATAVRHDEGDGTVRDTSRPVDRSADVRVKSAKTSAAATFALVFGLAALFCGLTGILAPFAVLFGIVGLALSSAGFKMTRRVGVTGRGVAVGGLLTSLLGLLLGLAVLVGLAVYVNDQGLDRLEQQIDNARDNLPSGRDVVENVPGVSN